MLHCKIPIILHPRPPSCSGPRVVLVGSTALLFSQKPLLLYNGELTCQTTSGKTSDVALSTHSFLRRSTDKSSDLPPEPSQQLAQALLLKRSDTREMLIMCAMVPLLYGWGSSSYCASELMIS